MKLQSIYLLLCVLGTLLPLSQFFPFLMEHGLDVVLFFELLFANPISGFFGLDVIVSAVVLIVFIVVEGKRLKMPNLWISFLGLMVGVSLAFPLFLWLRQRHLDQNS